MRAALQIEGILINGRHHVISVQAGVLLWSSARGKDPGRTRQGSCKDGGDVFIMSRSVFYYLLYLRTRDGAFWMSSYA